MQVACKDNPVWLFYPCSSIYRNRKGPWIRHPAQNWPKARWKKQVIFCCDLQLSWSPGHANWCIQFIWVITALHRAAAFHARWLTGSITHQDAHASPLHAHVVSYLLPIPVLSARRFIQHHDPTDGKLTTMGLLTSPSLSAADCRAGLLPPGSVLCTSFWSTGCP